MLQTHPPTERVKIIANLQIFNFTSREYLLTPMRAAQEGRACNKALVMIIQAINIPPTDVRSNGTLPFFPIQIKAAYVAATFTAPMRAVPTLGSHEP